MANGKATSNSQSSQSSKDKSQKMDSQTRLDLFAAASIFSSSFHTFPINTLTHPSLHVFLTQLKLSSLSRCQTTSFPNPHPLHTLRISMAKRVHPHASPPYSGEVKLKTTSSPCTGLASKPTLPVPAKPTPPPGTYIVKVPKDIVYRVPPPVNARRDNHYTGQKSGRSRCCCCLCWFIGLIFILLVLLGIAASVLYLVFRPEAPDYTVDGITVKGMDLTSAAEMSPEFDVAVRANNPNDKIGIYYERDSSVEVYYNDDVKLSNGVLPAFYQPSNNVTVFETALKGLSVVLRSTDRRALLDEQTDGRVPLKLKLKAPVKIKVGSVKTWKITVKVNCDITVDNLTEQAKIVSKGCEFSVDFW